MVIVVMQKYKSKQHEVLKFLLTIPKGKVITYKKLGDIFDLHPRVIASILKSNDKQNVYPCYKVVRSDGSVGGYNLGVEEKIKRLREEGIDVFKGKVDLEKHGV